MADDLYATFDSLEDEDKYAMASVERPTRKEFLDIGWEVDQWRVREQMHEWAKDFVRAKRSPIKEKAKTLAVAPFKGLYNVASSIGKWQTALMEKIEEVTGSDPPEHIKRLRETASENRDAFRQYYQDAQNKEVREHGVAGFATKAAEVAGGAMPAMALGAATMGAGAGPLAAAAAGTAISIPQMSAEIFEEAEHLGADRDTALMLSMGGVPLGALEIVGLGRIFNFLDKGSGGLAKKTLMGKILQYGTNAATQGIVETIEENVQQLGTNAVLKLGADRSRKLTEGIDWEMQGLSMFVGGAFGGLGTAIGDARRMQQPFDVDDATLAAIDQATDEQIELAEKRKGTDVDPSLFVNPTSGMVQIANMTGVFDLMKSGKNWVKGFTEKWVGRAGGIGNDFAELREGKDAAITARLRTVGYTMQDLKRAVDKSYTLSPSSKAALKVSSPKDIGSFVPAQDLGLIDLAMKGDVEALHMLPEPMRPVVTKARTSIDQLTVEAMRNNAIPSELHGVVGQEGSAPGAPGIGTYLRRSYQAFLPGQNKKWSKRIKKVDPGAVTLAENLIEKSRKAHWETRRKALIEHHMKTLPKKLEGAARLTEAQSLADQRVQAEISGQVQEILLNADRSMDVVEFGTNNPAVLNDLSSLRKRGDLPYALRRLLGEIKNPVANYFTTAHNLATMIEMKNFRSRMVEMGRDKFLFDRPVDLTEQGDRNYSEPLIDESQEKAYPELAGLYTDPRFKDEIMGTEKSIPYLTAAMKHYAKAVGTVKMSKTVYNWAGHVRNLLSGSLILYSNGHTGVRGVRSMAPVGKMFFADRNKTGYLREDLSKGMGIALANVHDVDLHSMTTEDVLREYATELTRLQVLGTGAQMADIKNTAIDLFGENATVDGTQKSMLKLMGRGVQEKSTKLWEAEDDFRRMWQFEGELALLDEAYGGALSPQELTDMAQKRVLELDPTYTRLPRVIDWLRKNVLGSSFPSWPAAMSKVWYNQWRQVARDLNDPMLRPYAYTRAVRMTSIPFGLSAMGGALGMALGVGRKEEEALRENDPDYAKNSTMFPLGKNDKGEYSRLDMSFWDPYDIINRSIRGGAEHGPLEGLSELVGPYLDYDILTKRALEVAFNEKLSRSPLFGEGKGGWVSNPQDPWEDRLKAGFKHLLPEFTPGTINAVVRIYKGIEGTPKKGSGRVYDPVWEALAATLGMRVTATDPHKSMWYAAARLKSQMREVQLTLTARLGELGEMPADELTRMYRHMEDTRRKTWEEMYRSVQATLVLTDNRRKVIANLDNRDWGADEIRSLLNGVYRPWVPTKAMRDSDIDRFRSANQFDRAAEVAERWKLVEGLAKAEYAKYKTGADRPSQ